MEVKCRRTMMAASRITSSVIFTSSLEGPRSYLDGILKNPSRFCAVFQRRGWRESLIRSLVVELHIYGVCDTAMLHDVHKLMYMHTPTYKSSTSVPGTSHTDCTTKLNFCRTHDHVHRQIAPRRPAMTR